jgi:hypothetical protein
MAFRRILGHVDFSTLTDSQKKEIKKSLQAHQKEVDAAVKHVDRALKKKKSKSKKR